MSSATISSSTDPRHHYHYCCSCFLYRHLLTVTLLLALLTHSGAGLKWESFEVPEMAPRGGEVTLKCHFSLDEGDQLYSVKWYKAGREFYRYVPGQTPTKQNFPFHGVTVDTQKSNDQQVALKAMTLDAAGRYKCEVLTEAPLFKTLVKSAKLMVYELPDGKPVVEGGQNQYRPGELVNLTCHVSRSFPATTLTWLINENKAPEDYLVHYDDTEDPDGRVTSRLGLRFKAERWHFPDGRVTLRCIAELHSVYSKHALHEGVVAPSDPLSLGHDAGGAGEVAVCIGSAVAIVVNLLTALYHAVLS